VIVPALVLVRTPAAFDGLKVAVRKGRKNRRAPPWVRARILSYDKTRIPATNSHTARNKKF
jgi:hypothetical protein